MKYIFELNHPKHYYQFKFIMRQLLSKGHEIKVLARNKDMLLNVLNQENIDYEIFGLHRKNIVAKIIETPKLLWNYYRLIKQYRPDIIISKASFYGCAIAKIVGAKSVIFPDSEVVKVTNHYVVPLASLVVTPSTFGLDYGKKHKRVKGFFENCYLSPSVMEEKGNFSSDNLGLKSPYAILRFVGWYANHDTKNNGLSLEEKKKIIHVIEPYMNVYISSEKLLPEDLKIYQLPTPSNKIHQVLSGADLYIGDSQTMATEAALLGVPAIRTNSFVGPNDMTNFVILEKQYGLLKNIRTFDNLLVTIYEMIKHPKKKEWIQKKNAYFAHVGDINNEIIHILESL